ncbi:hypothetical protein BDY21DRAFT_282437 [Lineolata rhizophorae]|uniref:MARVEL domain-containing protein n=1 Tax=Lineolata rhizophorae TaxID=578093 RepID=A0A6A6P762_9PEZI|nr:hypothetical protein BDY21DRAFT_282437 [Lineolata rhizophorae]
MPSGPVPAHDAEDNSYGGITAEDQQLKQRIRKLRLISRVLSALVAIGVFIPITMTLYKFLSTRDVFREVTRPDGGVEERTAWAKDSKTWPTYLYFGIAATGLLLNFGILVAYMRSVASANVVAAVAGVFGWLTVLGEIGVWIATVVVYRTEKRTDDLWGWSCSEAAQNIQEVFANEVNFEQYCDIQSVGWYMGILECAVYILTAVTYYLVYRRIKTKRQIKNISKSRGEI